MNIQSIIAYYIEQEKIPGGLTLISQRGMREISVK